MKVTLDPAARQERREAQRYYDAASERVGADFRMQLRNAIGHILHYPESGPVIGGVRRKDVAGFPYGIIYRVDDEGIFILAIAHESRKPLYWTGRL